MPVARPSISSRTLASEKGRVTAIPTSSMAVAANAMRYRFRKRGSSSIIGPSYDPRSASVAAPRTPAHTPPGHSSTASSRAPDHSQASTTIRLSTCLSLMAGPYLPPRTARIRVASAFVP